MSHDCMWASHLVWNATRLSIIRAKSLPEKLSSATSNAARFEPRDFLAILKPSVRMKNHYTKDLLIECCDHVLVKRVFPFDTHFGLSKFYQNPTFCHATELHTCFLG
ncbi:hypothetical protein OIU79_020218 [Salix purpurea]|uniref:Uncharacterized protein n=1 Tax=Salix purpurea TaxID=77065 RepID=A0A9Q0SKX4_SALPP|nr:hypothetical protein OIU79_020218 [Salix purpurea]